jgi:hypothetical protein
LWNLKIVEMKKYLSGFLVLFTLILGGCFDSDDGYSLGDIWVDFGIVVRQGSGSYDFTLKTDHGDVLFPVAAEIPLEVEDGSRVMINYTVLGNKKTGGNGSEYFVRINSLTKILKKGILDITTQNKDSIGNDPVEVSDHWVANNLLNLKIKYLGDTKVHYINLVKKPGLLTSASQPVELELRHNRNGDENRFPFAAYVSFDLTAIKIAGLDSVKYKVTSTGYNGDILIFSGVYKYGSTN